MQTVRITNIVLLLAASAAGGAGSGARQTDHHAGPQRHHWGKNVQALETHVTNGSPVYSFACVSVVERRLEADVRSAERMVQPNQGRSPVVTECAGFTRVVFVLAPACYLAAK